MSPNERLRQNLGQVRGRIHDAARRSGRPLGSVRLVAVTKRSPAELVALLPDLGQSDCGEDRPQALWAKAEALAGRPVRWHMIGHLQANKARRTLPLVAMVHAVDSLRLLDAIEESAGDSLPSLCLQVNVSGEPSKHGWSPQGLLDDALALVGRRSPIVGLMTMAALGTEGETARPAFAKLRELRDQLRGRTGLELPELSMGMSGDYEVAVEEGATIVRVGSAIFEGLEAP